jgi:hypothetical protein
MDPRGRPCDTRLRMVDHNSSSVPPLSPVAPGGRDPLELASRILSVLLLGWMAVLAGLAWLTWREGWTDLVLPVWNTLMVPAFVPIVVGIFARRLWAQRWVVGISTLTGISTAWSAMRSESTLLWAGAILLGVIALVVRRATHVFNDSDYNRGRVQRAIATIALIGSVVITIYVRQGTGSERGREILVREMHSEYTKVAPGKLRVYASKRSLVVEAPGDTNEQIDAAAEQMNSDLAATGKQARVWAVGFDSVVITNGSYSRTVTPYGLQLNP